MEEQPLNEARTALRTSGRPPGQQRNQAWATGSGRGQQVHVGSLSCEEKESTRPRVPPVPSRSGPQGGGQAGSSAPLVSSSCLPGSAFPVCDDLGVKAGDLPLQMEALVPGWVGGQTRDKFYTRATAIHHSVDT